ncbi:MAG: dTDP-4-dehydrorhamnose 3,5-epimerase [Agarilytica sp.]
MSLAAPKLIIDFSNPDKRGWFRKNYNRKSFLKEFDDFEVRESFFSLSKKDVIRGMHFQYPPYCHSKLVSCIHGRVIDVLLDIRNDSETYGKVFQFELNAEDSSSVYIPKGFAHGFKVVSDEAILHYMTDCEYEPNHDSGIRWDSFGHDWNVLKVDKLISDRDKQLPEFGAHTPFVLNGEVL